MKTKDRKKTKSMWILFGVLIAVMMATASLAMGQTPVSPNRETPEQPTAAGRQASPRAAGNSVTAGAFTLTGDGISSSDYSYISPVLTIKSRKEITIRNTNAGETTDRIKIQLDSSSQSAGAHLILAGVNSRPTSGAALEIEENATYNVNITLAEGSENVLTSSNTYAGLQKNGDTSTGTLTIGGTGSLKATGGGTAEGGAGIGGGSNKAGSGITITGGTVTATGGTKAAGIGGGMQGSGRNITIRGGMITATGGQYGSGIGGGQSGGGSGNKLEGNAMVRATSGSSSTPALKGFAAGDLKQGVAFTREGTTVQFTGTVYGTVATANLPGGSLTIPNNTITLTIPKDSTLSVSSGYTLIVPNSVTLHNAAGMLNANKSGYGNINCDETGKVTVQMDYEVHGGAGGPSAHQILYQDKDGANKKYDATADLASPTTPPAANQHFAGWYSDDGTFTSQVTKETLIDCSLHKLFAKWNPDTCTVRFNSKGGSSVTPETVNYGATVRKPDDPTKPGYKFVGWYKESECTNAWDFNNDTVEGDITLYAKWAENIYTVTFDTQGGSPDSWTTQVKEGETVAKPASDPTRTGYTFTDWYANGNPYDFTKAVTSDLTIYAKWLGDEHNIVVPEQPIGGTIEITDKARTGDAVTFTAVPDSGYQIKGLPQANTTDAAANGSIDVTPTGNANEYRFEMPNSAVNITAEFELVPQPGPTPGPTPDPSPSVDPGSGGSGGSGRNGRSGGNHWSRSAKTMDPFAGGANLALLGAAALMGIAIKRRK